MKKNIWLLAIVFFIPGCEFLHMNPGWAKTADFNMDPPDGPEIYQQGYKDGCQSGYSAYATSFNKLFWTWKQDPELAQNEVYYKIWKDAYSYCALWGMMGDEHGLGNWR